METKRNFLINIIKRKWSVIIAFIILVIVLILVGGLRIRNKMIENSRAVDVIIKHLEALKNNDYNSWKATLWVDANGGDINSFEKEGDLGVISLDIDKVNTSEKETIRIKNMYKGSDLAKSHEWSDKYIEENMISVFARYTIDYDNTKVPYTEGDISQYFYLIRNDKNSPWFIWDESYDVYSS
jgi:hypothetical protein